MNIASKILNAAGLTCVLVLQAFSAKVTTWTGNAGTTDWATDGNWDKGAPTAEDTAKIIGSPNSVTVNIASPASVYILYLQGTVTLNGAELTITGKTATASGGGVKAWEQAGGGTYTYNCPLKFTNPLSGNVALSGTAYICGGIDYGNTFTAAGMGTTYIRNTPIRTNKFSPLNNKVYIEVPSNSLGGVTFGGPAAEIHVMVDDPWLDTGFDSLTITQGAKLELHGHRCHVTNKLVMTSGSLNTDEPATLAFSQRSGGVIQTNSSVEISGPLTLRMDSSSTKHFVLNRSISSSGSLIVEGGTFHFGPNAG